MINRIIFWQIKSFISWVQPKRVLTVICYSVLVWFFIFSIEIFTNKNIWVPKLRENLNYYITYFSFVDWIPVPKTYIVGGGGNGGGREGEKEKENHPDISHQCLNSLYSEKIWYYFNPSHGSFAM